MILVVIGMTVITGGAASILHFSPLCACFFLGICLSNLDRNKERIFNMLVNVEKPIYLLVMVFLGVNWTMNSSWFFILAFGYGLLRGVGKLVSGYTIRGLGDEFKTFPSFIGLGLLTPGGLALAILLDFQYGFPKQITTDVVCIALLAIIYSDFAGPHFLKKVIR